ncbi:2-methylisocitrate lyase, mitochondrial {ECO:0000303/PubMed:7117251, ECO:0000303/Ref.2, ECO:0000303/Ref.3, ECO:0000303/Ref.4} {ECO:0000269/PubMed:7117251, ECO:0000269/Ref.2, ECO:0000269/Ref.3, ECO:0000269/Ref.4}; Flags: Precursor [Serendipita indica DSM 11827]|uniref:Isocitrate lyase n=1 Tax=Serendipita indica (strain DSM 11827) TaxID=1109443 RepID=G4TCF7_SERID|nr:2-methylisocitrate lyase, mitochondrial {ECO:0000303/PubMed:7117251, ECO:0000303/Ref.2, ECO:0000303/Ref.3, ECO:0000303/Ref.4} {ECO:0000269/PubMed:7117251, ECO:0000269/Ref.2, ECO:0000269/Ref.3, ECO:0000269/Ref.4}; Flags: Precursor [Serendipita indica DSM 11827]CCA68981.1 probable isocitrate lyase [Serendipita indica DSM 11827]
MLFRSRLSHPVSVLLGTNLRQMRASSSLPLDPPSPDEETKIFHARCAEVESFFKSPRFAGIKRPYTAKDVVSKQGSFPPVPLPGSLLSDKLFALFARAAKEKRPVHTMGAIDPVQVTQMARYQEVVYVSGWAASSVLTTANNEVGPDLSDYPYTTVPNQVHRLFRAQQLHDRKHYDERMTATPEARKSMEQIDYLRPIIADADTGHGGISSVMKLAKIFAESGASGIHLEDQLHGGKKCGHQAGKVIVPTSTHITRLIASRFQLDVIGSTMHLIARTDSESAKLISSTVDKNDHEFILGTMVEGTPLAEVLDEAEAQGKSGPAVDNLEKEWLEKHPLVTFDQAVEIEINSSQIADKASALSEYKRLSSGRSNLQARQAAKHVLGTDVRWSWDLPKTREGYYHFKGGVEAAIKRSNLFAPYADLLWLETKKPDLEQATGFARRIREVHPGKMLVYNLSPSFNWSAHGFTDDKLKSFVWDLAKEGFVFQLISLAGIHSTATVTVELARRFQSDGMLAYVELIQRKEKELECDVLTHQKWSGAGYIDRMLSTVMSGSSSTSGMGADSTEHTF